MLKSSCIFLQINLNHFIVPLAGKYNSFTFFWSFEIDIACFVHKCVNDNKKNPNDLLKLASCVILTLVSAGLFLNTSVVPQIEDKCVSYKYFNRNFTIKKQKTKKINKAVNLEYPHFKSVSLQINHSTQTPSTTQIMTPRLLKCVAHSLAT